MKLFRVFPYDASAAETDEGGALYVPAPSPLGRIANIDLFRELYFAERPECAVAETFGFLAEWHASDFVHAGGLPFALGTYELDNGAKIFDLNDIRALEIVGIEQPSRIVTCNRGITQAWARRIFELGRYRGASWWSYYYPEWTALGLWDLAGLRCTGPIETLTPAHPAVEAAARTIVRQRL